MKTLLGDIEIISVLLVVILMLLVGMACALPNRSADQQMLPICIVVVTATPSPAR